LNKHVPVRFDAGVIKQVQQLADEAGVTVSSWIRASVEREIRRQTPDTRTTLVSLPQYTTQWQGTEGESVTTSDAEGEQRSLWRQAG
jgi:hypothetical protein